MKLTLVLALVFLSVSCNNSSETSGKAPASHADSLLADILKSHDTAMAKMMKIDPTKNKIQHLIDSISTLSYHLQKSSSEYKRQLDSIFNRLTFANYAMQKWMDEFNMDTLKANEAEREAYMQSEKLKITKVNELMLNCLQKADSVLNKK
jgi:DNA polymerase III psi subunit